MRVNPNPLSRSSGRARPDAATDQHRPAGDRFRAKRQSALRRSLRPRQNWCRMRVRPRRPISSSAAWAAAGRDAERRFHPELQSSPRCSTPSPSASRAPMARSTPPIAPPSPPKYRASSVNWSIWQIFPTRATMFSPEPNPSLPFCSRCRVPLRRGPTGQRQGQQHHSGKSFHPADQLARFPAVFRPGQRYVPVDSGSAHQPAKRHWPSAQLSAKSPMLPTTIDAQRVFYGNALNQLNAQQTYLNTESTQLAQQQNTVGGADLTAVITNLTSAQTSLQATLEAIGQTANTNLFNI